MSTVLTCFTELKKPDGVVVFPTDTVWGLGCLPENEAAVDRIYALKGRAETKPLILLGTHWEDFGPFIDMTGISEDLLSSVCLEGDVTVVFPTTPRVSHHIHRGLETIGCRVPDCKPLRDLLNQVPGHVLATTSANPSGKPPAETREEAVAYFGHLLGEQAILSAPGFVSQGTPSTVVGVAPNDEITVFRQGEFMLPARFRTAEVV